MNDTTPSANEPANTASAHFNSPAQPDTSTRLYHVLAWVGIIAGIVFITGAVFSGGYLLGRQSADTGHPGKYLHHAISHRNHHLLPPRPGRDGYGPMHPGMGSRMGPDHRGMNPGGPASPGANEERSASVAPAP